MLIDFFLHLKENRLPVSIKEFLALLEALQQHVIEHSLDDFYVLSRAILVKDETHFDKFDRAFGEYFKGVEALPGMEALIPEEWLRQAVKKHLSDAERAKLEKLGWDKLMETFKQRLAEQKERHSGGSKWIGTAALRPSGTAARIPRDPCRRQEREPLGGQGLGKARVSQPRRQRRTRHAQHQDRTASPAPLCPPGRARGTGSRRHHRRYRAQRRLARPALRPERHNAVKVLLFLDIGGSMDDHIRVCEELFSACHSEFKHLEYYYFHNCVYEYLWKDNRRRHSERIATHDVLHRYGNDYKLIFVGDAAMSPYEIVQPWGSVEYNNAEPGATWLRRLTDTWPHAIWLNPESEHAWQYRQSTSLIHNLMGGRMFPLTLDGLERGMRLLSK
jgi:uncharacterized protein with von Willebrand factor type A (vWA) domain